MKSEIAGGLVHELPADLAEALVENNVVCIWESISAIGRNEYICWIEDAKQEKTRINRILRATESLQEGKKRPCCWAGCVHRTDKKPGKWQQDVLIDKKARK
ncbi:MAG: YdeI/OmpD-associated family protein [Gammaproteobacteria bacterium]|nr:YdeI/OmpD-associated family protein [Gammaproteobacteria bacterium]